MTLPSSGVLAASAVNTELQASSSAPFQLSDALVRYLAKKQAAGSPISMSDLRGRSFTATLSNINPPSGSDNINTSQRSIHVSANGNVMAVLANSNGSTAVVGSANVRTGGGAVLIYERNSSGVFQLASTFLFPSYGPTNEAHGVSVNDDGSRVVVAGAVEANGFTHPSSGPTNWFWNGAVETFYKSSGSWVRGTPVTTDYVYWSGYFGPTTSGTRHVSLSGDGSTMVVSVDERGDPPGSGTVGAIYVYTYVGSGTWTRTQKIKPTGTTSNPYYHVQLSTDGNVLLVGAGSSPTAAWVYKKVSGSYTFFASYEPALTGIIASDPDLAGSTGVRGEYAGYELSRDGQHIMARVYAQKSGVTLRRHVWCDIGPSSITPQQVLRLVPSSFGIISYTSTEYSGLLCLSGDGNRVCLGFRTVGSSFQTTGTYMVFWFRHPTTGVWTYQGSVGTAYDSPPGNAYYYQPSMNTDGTVGACATVATSNLVVQITS